jgi:nucleotide-binding universal stress UspA family protein
LEEKIMKSLEKILYVTDFGQAAQNALGMAIYLAKTYHSEIILVHVIPEIKDSPVPPDTVRDTAAGHAEKIKGDLQRQGIQKVQSLVSLGSPFNQIIKLAEDHDVNVILMGSGDKTSKDKFPLGITAEKVIRKASRPVWIVKRGTSPAVKNILCPVDFSEPSSRALTNAIQLSRILGGHLTVLTVWEPLKQFYEHLGHWLTEESWIPDESRFDRFLEGFDFRNLSWSKVARTGKAHEEILAISREVGADLLVMGSVGRTGLSKILIGSVAQKVIREMPCSVVTFKAELADTI